MKKTTFSQIKQDLKTIYRNRFPSFETRKKWEIVVTTLCHGAFVSGVLILLIMGGTIYAEEHPKELTYLETTCQVYNTSYNEYWCLGRLSRTKCYAPVWYIFYGGNQSMNNGIIIGYNRFRSLPDAIRKTKEYQIGSSYPCWYDPKKISEIQWEQPNSRTGLILLIFGGLTIIPTIISLVLVYTFCKQIRKHQRM